MALLAGAGTWVTAGTRNSGVKLVREEVPVTALHHGSAPANNSPSLVVDPTESRFVVMVNRLDAPDYSCAIQVSGDGGRSWNTVARAIKPPPGAEKCYAPEAAFDGDGTLYYLFVGLAGPGNQPMGAFLSTSRDRGDTFTTPVRVLGPLNFSVRMALDPTMGPKGRLHLVWLQATSAPSLGGFGPPPNPIMAAYSDDGGSTFSTPVQVSDSRRRRVAAPALVLGPDHAVHVAYYDLDKDAIDYQGLEGPVWDGHWSVVLSSSLDGGQRFGRGVVVDRRVAPTERVMLIFTMPPPAMVMTERRLCLAWPDVRHGDADVLLRCSRDAGREWSRPRRLNDDALGNGRAQYLPRLAAAPDGRIDAIFFDRRRDPQNIRNDVSFTYSHDGGRTFSPNVRVTREPSSSRIGQRYAHAAAKDLVEFGGRVALVSNESGALAAWTDTRNSLEKTTGQDIFATEVVMAPGDNPTRRRAGALLMGAGAAALVVLVVRRRSPRQERR